ncbi:MAG: outer membrane beta-barrel protein [Saprospiraceae bacterium]|nr:outer membrane beta-barrel protein [Saprospiraceae bacterium]
MNSFSKTIASLFMVAMMCFSQIAFGQGRLSFELRPGVNVPTEKLGDVSLNTGFGFEGTFAYRFMPHLAIYGGWSWNKFASDMKINDTALDFEETGYTYGLQFIHPIGDSKMNIILRAGGLYNHIEVEQGSEIISDTGHGFGWQVEGRLPILLGEKWSVIPSLRYRTLSRDLKIESVTNSVDLNYLLVGLGLSVKF